MSDTPGAGPVQKPQPQPSLEVQVAELRKEVDAITRWIEDHDRHQQTRSMMEQMARGATE